jgi:hypothetical protein
MIRKLETGFALILCTRCSSKNGFNSPSKIIDHSKLRAPALRAGALAEPAPAYAVAGMPHASARPAFCRSRQPEQPMQRGAVPEPARSAAEWRM